MKRVGVSMSEETYEILQQWAESEGRTIPNLLSFLVKNVADDKQKQEQRQQKAG